MYNKWLNEFQSKLNKKQRNLWVLVCEYDSMAIRQQWLWKKANYENEKKTSKVKETFSKLNSNKTAKRCKSVQKMISV